MYNGVTNYLLNHHPESFIDRTTFARQHCPGGGKNFSRIHSSVKDIQLALKITTFSQIFKSKFYYNFPPVRMGVELS